MGLLGSLLRPLASEAAARARLLGTLAAARLRRRRQPLRRSRPHVLFVMERWCDCNPAAGRTNSSHNLVGSLVASGVASHAVFPYDAFHLRARRPAALGLFRAVLRERPDVLVVSVVLGQSICPPPFALELCRRLLGVPVVLVWFDFVLPEVRALAARWERAGTASVVLDAPTLAREGAARHRILPMWTPQDPRVFRPREAPRDLDVCFLGSVAPYPERRQAVAALAASGLRVFTGGGQREQPLSLEDYAATLARSRIAVNFSRHWRGPDLRQSKGRVFEALHCGAALLEERNPETAHWLREGEEYAGFDGPGDLMRAVRELLADPARLGRIAAAGRAAAATRFGASRFWESVLQAAGVPAAKRD